MAEKPSNTEPATEDGPVERDEYTAKQIATRIGVDAKVLRKFFRSTASTVEPVGQGGRYVFDAADMPKIKAEFEAYQKGKPARTPGGATKSTKSKGRQAPAAAEVIEDDDELLELDDDEPTDDELLELDEEPIDADDIDEGLDEADDEEPLEEDDDEPLEEDDEPLTEEDEEAGQELRREVLEGKGVKELRSIARDPQHKLSISGMNKAQVIDAILASEYTESDDDELAEDDDIEELDD